MQRLVCDANVLIDFEEGELLEMLFGLPYEFYAPDLLFHEELANEHSHLLGLGLLLGALDGEGVAAVVSMGETYPAPSRNDLTALILAQLTPCPLLTGDKNLRAAAEAEGLVVMGTIWILKQILLRNLATVEAIQKALQKMEQSGRRLPWERAREMIEQLPTND